MVTPEKRMRRRLMWLPILAVISGGLAPAGAVADGGSVGCDVAAAHGAAPGAVITSTGGLAVEAPGPGAGVGAESYGADGSESLVVSRTMDGVLVVSGCGASADSEADGAVAQAEGAASPNACRDDAFKLYGFKWTQPYPWFFNPKTTPGELTTDQAQQALIDGMNAVTGLHTDCSATGHVSATHVYQGRTDARADFDGARCKPFGHTDHMSVVDFGNLPATKLAKTCFYFTRSPGFNIATEADIRFNKADFLWAGGAGGPGCKNRFSLRGVATHEAGHVFGLAHVQERTHGELTMSKINEGPCQESEYTLGLGDIDGLMRLYGEP